MDWCAFGVVRKEEDVLSYNEHLSENQGTAVVSRDSLMHVMHSFYGPNSRRASARFRAGLSIAQNRAALKAANIAVVSVGEDVILPELLKEKWVRRVDVTVIYRRRLTSIFDVRYLLSTGEVELNVDATVPPGFNPPQLPNRRKFALDVLDDGQLAGLDIGEFGLN